MARELTELSTVAALWIDIRGMVWLVDEVVGRFDGN